MQNFRNQYSNRSQISSLEAFALGYIVYYSFFSKEFQAWSEPYEATLVNLNLPDKCNLIFYRLHLCDYAAHFPREAINWHIHIILAYL